MASEGYLADEFQGATFGEARHSQEALDLVCRESWDVVILDMGLPGRGGLDVLKQIRAEVPSCRSSSSACIPRNSLQFAR